jgi:hypothetical protein
MAEEALAGDILASAGAPSEAAPQDPEGSCVIYSTIWNGVDRYTVRLSGRRLWVTLGEGRPDAMRLLKGVRYEQVWRGCSPLNETTAFSGGHGPEWDANALLFRLHGAGSMRPHLFVGGAMYAFDWPADEPIERFVSCVGNSCVPYPYAVTRTQALFFLDATALPRNMLGEAADCATADLYEQYYDLVALHQARPRPPLLRAPQRLNPRQGALEPNPAFSGPASATEAPPLRGLSLRFMCDDRWYV